MITLSKKEISEAYEEFAWENDPYMRACYVEQHVNHLETKAFAALCRNDKCANCGKPLGSLPWSGSERGKITHGFNCS